MKIKYLLIASLFFFSTQLYSQCFLQSSGRLGNYNIYQKSGNQAVNGAFYEVNTYLSNIFSLSVKYGFYDDSSGPNAFAMPHNSRSYDGQTYFGLRMINKFTVNGKVTLPSIRWIVAHEYAHILQFKMGRQWEKTKWNELQADYLAGWAISQRLLLNSLDEDPLRSAVERSFKLFESLGDTQFGSPDHHGTSDERGAALAKGMLIGVSKNKSRNNAWNKSVAYINKLRSTPTKKKTKKASLKYDKIYFKNKCSKKIKVLIRIKNLEGEWVSKGWYGIEPGESAFVSKTKNSIVYWYAKEGKRVWSGDHNKTFKGKEYGLKRWKIESKSYGEQVKTITCRNR